MFRDPTQSLTAKMVLLEAELEQTRAMGAGRRARERVLVGIAVGSVVVAATCMAMSASVSADAQEQRDRRSSLRAELEREQGDHAACRADVAAAFEKEQRLIREMQGSWQYNGMLTKTLRQLPLCPATCRPPGILRGLGLGEDGFE
jgi:hypothetical protein